MVPQPPVGQELLSIMDSQSQADIPHLVGLLWVSDQPWHTHNYLAIQNTHNIQTSTQTHNCSKQAGADPHLRSRSHWDQLSVYKHSH